MTGIPQTQKQKKLEKERSNLQRLLDDHPTVKQRDAAEMRISDINVNIKIDGWVSSKGLNPPK